MALIYRIKDWADHFETKETMGLPEMRYVPFPNKHDGDGYNELVSGRHGAAYFGAWCALVQVASKSKPRGTLIRDGNRPHDSASLARQTRLPKRLFDAVLPRLVAIKWLEAEEQQGTLDLGTGPPNVPKPHGLSASSSSSPPEVDHSRSEIGEAEKIALRFFVIAGQRSPAGEWALTETKLSELQETFPAVDVLSECRKARGWIVANPTKRKTATGMPAFLFRWLSRVQNSGGTPGFGGGGNSGGSGQVGNQTAAQRRSNKLRDRDYEGIAHESLRYDEPGDSGKT